MHFKIEPISFQKKSVSLQPNRVDAVREQVTYFRRLNLNCVQAHCWYIEPWNREKSLRLIWQRFSCLLDEWIEKVNDTTQQSENSHMWIISKSHREFIFYFFIFAIHLSSRHEKRCQMSVRLFSLFQGSIYNSEGHLHKITSWKKLWTP